MSDFEKLVQQLNDLKIEQKQIFWEENIPEEIWTEHFKDVVFTEVKSGLDVDTHRWYEVSTTVIQLGDNLLGVTHITNLFSESSACEDCCVQMYFAKMKEVQAISYVVA